MICSVQGSRISILSSISLSFFFLSLEQKFESVPYFSSILYQSHHHRTKYTMFMLSAENCLDYCFTSQQEMYFSRLNATTISLMLLLNFIN